VIQTHTYHNLSALLTIVIVVYISRNYHHKHALVPHLQLERQANVQLRESSEHKADTYHKQLLLNTAATGSGQCSSPWLSPGKGQTAR